jgi:hypothetical protein
MEYQGVASQNYYNHPKVQLANASYGSNNYFASSINSHVDVASHNHIRYVASANTYNNVPHHTHHNYGYYGQEPMSTVDSLNFDTTSNIQRVNPCSSAISSQYVVHHITCR